MTFFIRWAVRFLALATIILIVIAVGTTRAILTPPKHTRVYSLTELNTIQPLATANLTHQLKTFMNAIPQVTALRLEVPEVQANALASGALLQFGIPLTGSRVIFEENQVAFTMALNLSDLQKIAPNERLKTLRLPFPLDSFRTNPLTITLVSNLKFDPVASRLILSQSTLLLGQLDVTSAPRFFWQTQMGRGIIRVTATALGMDELAALKLSTTDASVGLLTSVVEDTLNTWLKDLEQGGTLKIQEFSITKKNLRLMLGIGQKVIDQLDYIDKVRSNPYYYGVAKGKFLSGELSKSECASAKRTLEAYKTAPKKNFSEEETEAIKLLKEVLERKNSPCK